MMNAQEIIHYIATAEKKTPVKITLREKAGEAPISFGSAKVFGVGDKVIFGDWKELGPILEANRSKIDDMVIENDCRNSAIPLLDLKGINARIEPGAVIRDQVTIGDGAVVMMGRHYQHRRGDRRRHHDRYGRCDGRTRHCRTPLPHWSWHCARRRR